MTETISAATMLTNAEVKVRAAAIAREFEAAAQAPSQSASPIAGTGGGSLHRRLPAPLRQRFIDLRDALYRRGIFDPVLARFDSATVAQAPLAELAQQLATIAESL